jgi:hypothetical protein
MSGKKRPPWSERPWPSAGVVKKAFSTSAPPSGWSAAVKYPENYGSTEALMASSVSAMLRPLFSGPTSPGGKNPPMW